MEGVNAPISVREKIFMYRSMLERFNVNLNSHGICILLYHYYWNKTGKHLRNVLEVQALFPEILKYKPENMGDFQCWWSFDREGNEQRKQVIINIIKDLEDEETSNDSTSSITGRTETR